MSDRYTLWDRAALFRYQERERAILQLLDRQRVRPLDDVKVLDVGCGDGGTLRDFLDYGARPENLAGVDILDVRISRAKRLAPNLDYRVADASALPFSDGAFDLALAFTLFSSVTSPPARARIAGEMRRVVRPGGGVLWYDFWVNPNPSVEALGLDEVRRLFGREPAEASRVTLAPPIARRLASRSWLGCELLAKLPPLRTHWLALVRV